MTFRGDEGTDCLTNYSPITLLARNFVVHTV